MTAPTTSRPTVYRPVAVPPASPVRPSSVRAHPRLILALITLGALAAVGLWWQNTPSVHGYGDWLTNAGRILGLLAGYCMVVLIALMARIPPLERGIGADRLARWHAMGGRYAVSLVVAHALLITWGYAVTAHTSVVSQTGTLLNSYPDVLMATVAGLLLVGVGISSARAARRKLRYETWYFLHFYTYLAVALAFSHQFSVGDEFVNNPAARWVWGSMYAAVASAILWYRFVRPIRQALRQRLTVTWVREERPGVVSLVISGPHIHELRAESGQFFRWRFLTRDLWWVSSPYSLSAGPRPDVLRITIKDLGDHSRALAALKPGTRVLAEGPFGSLTAAARHKRKVLLIAGGVGITPLRALFETIPAAAGDLTLLYRASTSEEIVFRDELEHIAATRNAHLMFWVGRRKDLGREAFTASVMTRAIPDIADHDIYICGPAGMTTTVKQALHDAGVRRRQIHDESFSF